MSQYDYIPGEDAQLQLWLNNFSAACEQYETVLGLDAEELFAINGAATDFATGLTNVSTAKAEFRQSVAAKNNIRQDSVAIVRTFAREFKANPAIPEDVLFRLGIIPTRNSNPVTMVKDLSVVGCDNGVNSLQWNRTGNTPATQFVIEYRIDGQSNWNFAAAITRVKYNHEGQTPGEKVWYRITSTRSGVSSVPCPAVAAYGDSTDSVIQLAS